MSNNISRRAFLKCTGASAAALGAASLLGGCQKKEEAAKLEKIYGFTDYSAVSNGNNVANHYELFTYSDGTYMLKSTTDYYMNMDPHEETVGELVITTGFMSAAYLSTVSFGKFTSAVSSDGDPTHVEIKMEKASRVIHEQHGLILKWVLTGIMTNFVGHMDSDNWNDAYAEFFPDANAFLAEYAHSYTVTVSDPSVAGQPTGMFGMLAAPVAGE